VREFRNGVAISWEHLHYQAIHRAVFWNGQEIRNVGLRGGFADTVVEIWGLQEYTAHGFYTPRNGDVIFDIGANIGLFSIWVARQAPQARVFAYEPVAENYATLQTNLAGCAHSVRAHQAAVGASDGVGMMLDGGARSLDHRLTMASTDAGGGVRVVTLDQAVHETGGNPIDLLKVDIEGAELDMLAAASPSTLKRIRRVALEYHDNIRPGTKAEVSRILAQTHRIVSESGDSYGIIRAERAE
jgi:FkbM family methyltransferase